jgi:methylated-DNA-[protein]-cysteine S-methyltransferase
MSTIAYTTYVAPLGPMVIAASSRGLVGIWFDGQKHFAGTHAGWRRDDADARLCAAREQLAEYFAGARTVFALECDARGTPFQQAVWRAIAAVPYGRQVTYAALAAAAGTPGAARAAGAATGRNPLSIVVPCHRIVGSTGALTGYAGGLARKEALLALERRDAGAPAGTTGQLWGDATPSVQRMRA